MLDQIEFNSGSHPKSEMFQITGKMPELDIIPSDRHYKEAFGSFAERPNTYRINSELLITLHIDLEGEKIDVPREGPDMTYLRP